MRNTIKEYIELTDTEKQDLWENATFVFDTNVFFNLYRYSKKTRDALLGAMTELKDRIWMPYQVAYEFMRKRPEIIYESKERYSGLADEMLRPCKDKLRIKNDDPDFLALQEYIQKWIENSKNTNLLVESWSKDPVLETILDLFDGKVGPAYTVEDLEKVKKEGLERYKKKIPPGYKDGAKATSGNDNNAYGDLIVWKQTMDYAATKRINIIFVTHDQKEDWWNTLHGKTIGPREELKKEFTENTKMQFHMYTMDSFISRYQTTKDSTLDASVIDEVKSYSDVPSGATTIVQALGEYTSLLRESLTLSNLPDINAAIAAIESKKARREAELISITHKYEGKKKPHAVKIIEHNLQKNIMEDESVLRQLNYKRNTLVHSFGSIPT